ncbi:MULTISPECIES: alpha/beta-type small acid-soluble spore protein [unclassified Paenibacillus]|uniref:alpha/beta-type small acid-soluble spore protein n=1 Tax=unclassified Paenibacillus TaxID=185978 RepID=UPI0010512EB2|nr:MULTISPECIES: alpha/beta-type small acid-soluble spore protein [unclassified Paenibacillus]NIK68653.1 small acid-soluble spore protein A (major alpha-type SASP) [Paenibacillus sp. BK720]TCM99062.1 small acid-soluble spore protein A (major alpha-type SASP) [Paenibacillus sp. BK033]
MARSNSNTLVVPQAAQALDQIKFEVASELGISLSRDGYNGDITTYNAGKIGGSITRRLVEIAEQSLGGASNNFRR